MPMGGGFNPLQALVAIAAVVAVTVLTAGIGTVIGGTILGSAALATGVSTALARRRRRSGALRHFRLVRDTRRPDAGHRLCRRDAGQLAGLQHHGAGQLCAARRAYRTETDAHSCEAGAARERHEARRRARVTAAEPPAAHLRAERYGVRPLFVSDLVYAYVDDVLMGLFDDKEESCDRRPRPLQMCGGTEE